MDVLIAATAMDSEETLITTAPDTPQPPPQPQWRPHLRPAQSVRATTGGSKAKPKVPKKLLLKEEKGV
jgi:hypothetical protein